MEPAPGGPALASPDRPFPGLDAGSLAVSALPWGNWNVTPGSPRSPVILTRLLAYRNFAGLPFFASAPPNLAEAAAARALDHIARAGAPAPLRLAECPSRIIRLLREREILPWRALALPGKKASKRLSVAPDGSSWILVNEGEHLTFGRVLPGSPEPSAVAAAFPYPQESPSAPWARSTAYGFLASDPGRLGPGVAVEQIVHLPGLALARLLPSARNLLAVSGLSFVPAMPAQVSFPGPADAGLFRVGSKGRLGRTPEQAYADHMEALTPVLEREIQSRNECLARHPKKLGDRVANALERLSTAKSIPHPDFLSATSLVRLGAALSMLPPEFEGTAEYLRVTVASGHLAVSSGGDLSQEDEDFKRANVVRSSLENLRGIGT